MTKMLRNHPSPATLHQPWIRSAGRPAVGYLGLPRPLSRFLFENRQNASDRRFDPIRTVIRLVIHLVERLPEEMQAHQPGPRGVILDPDRTARRRLLVGAQESLFGEREPVGGDRCNARPRFRQTPGDLAR